MGKYAKTTKLFIDIFHLISMNKLLINKVFSFIFSSFFASLFILTENTLFMSYSIATIIIYFILDNLLYTIELQKNVNKVLDYIFFYLDTDSQRQLFMAKTDMQVQNLVNIWFLIELYLNKRYKNVNVTMWTKDDQYGFLNYKKNRCIRKYLSENKNKMKNNKALFGEKQKFISYLVENIEKEGVYQEVFTKLETALKDDPYFLRKLHSYIVQLPKDFNEVSEDHWKILLKAL